MKKTWLSLLTLAIVAFGLLSFYSSSHPDNESELTGRIMAFREVSLQNGANATDFERFAAEQLTPAFKQGVPGVESYLLKGERGDNKGQYVHLLIFDSKRTRDLYFPYEHSGEAEIQGDTLSLWRPGQIMLLDSLPKYTKSLEGASYTDYIFLE